MGAETVKVITDIIGGKDINRKETFSDLKKIETDANTGSIKQETGPLKKETLENVEKTAQTVEDKGEEFLQQQTALGTMGDLLGIERIYDTVKDIPILGALCREIHSQKIKARVDNIQTDGVKEAFGGYLKTNKETIATGQSTWELCKLEELCKDMSEESKTKLKDKIPENYASLKANIVNLIEKHPDQISPAAIKGISNTYIKKENKTESIDVTKVVTDKEKIAESYLRAIITKLVTSGDTFINSPTITTETFALAVFGNLTGDKYFVEGVELGLLTTSEFTPTENKVSTDNSGIVPTETTPPATDKLVLDEKKNIKELSFAEAQLFAQRTFGKGPATDLLIAMSNNNPALITRVIALGKHEGGLKFGRHNDDPATASGQINIGTFQISAKPNLIADKWNTNIEAGKKLLAKYPNIKRESDYFNRITNYVDNTATTKEREAQTDLIVRLGFAGEKKLTELADPSISETRLKELIHKEIQVGIPAIGEGVVAQINSNQIEDYPAIAA